MDSSQIATVGSFLLAAPIFVAWGFALVDIARRPELGRPRKLVYGAVLVLFVPATLVYLLSRPTIVASHRARFPWTSARPSPAQPDWRGKLLSRLEQGRASPPLTSRSEDAMMIERVMSATRLPAVRSAGPHIEREQR